MAGLSVEKGALQFGLLSSAMTWEVRRREALV